LTAPFVQVARDSITLDDDHFASGVVEIEIQVKAISAAAQSEMPLDHAKPIAIAKVSLAPIQRHSPNAAK
jgi:hypothetical protein